MAVSVLPASRIPKKTSLKRKWGVHKRIAPRSVFATPIKRTKIQLSPERSAPETSTPVKVEEVTTAESKLVKRLKLKREEKVDLIVRTPNLKEKVVKVAKVRSNIVIDSDVFQTVLDVCAVCAVCQIGKLSIWDKGTRSCFANYLTLRCQNCSNGMDFWTLSGKFPQHSFDIQGTTVKRRNDSIYQSMLAGRLIGVGQKPLNIFHSMIGIGLPPSHFIKPQKDLLRVAEFIAKLSMDKAALELEKKFGKYALDNVHDIASFDGDYQKRSTKSGGGYSRYCFGSVISMSNGKVLAYDVACNNCSRCTFFENQFLDKEVTEEIYVKNLQDHEEQCPAKYAAFSSVSLESELAPKILSQALDRHIIFDGLVCDGDNKTFSKISECSPYKEIDPNHELKRYECLAHVGKRMKGHLINHQKDKLKRTREDKKREEIVIEESTTTIELQTQMKKKVSSKYAGKLVRTNIQRGEWKDLVPTRLLQSPVRPSKGASAKSRKNKAPIELKYLSDEMCSRITSFYQLTVKQNAGDIAAILKSIDAIPLHLGANEANAEQNHALCPLGENSWCRYQRARAIGELPPRHPNYLSEQAVELVREIFTKFHYNTPSFVAQVADGQTSNHNEAVHGVLFSMVRKTGQCSMDIMKLGSALAVIRYNDGMVAVLTILETLKVEVHPGLLEIATNLDNRRIEASKRQRVLQSRRFTSRMRHQRKNTASIRLFGRGYDSGKFSASNVVEAENPPESLPPFSLRWDDEIPKYPSSSAGPSSSGTTSSDVFLSGIKICPICLRGDDDGVIESINICIDANILNWIQCYCCEKNFHFHCVGLDEAGEPSDSEWICLRCNNDVDAQSTDDD